MKSPTIKQTAKAVISETSDLLNRQIEMEVSVESALAQVDPGARASARNLVHYLAVRQLDIRPLQWKLIHMGLTSLGGMEASSMCSVQAVHRALHSLAGETAPEMPEPPVDFSSGPLALQANANRLLGEPSGKRSVRIMVTMPSEAAGDYGFVLGLLRAGMDVMRINCAHDDASAWKQMVANLRRAERETGRACKVYADLGGPKLRTGPIEPIGKIRKVRPLRDPRGVVLLPARIWFLEGSYAMNIPNIATDVIPVSSGALDGAIPGCLLVLEDARGKTREFKLISCGETGALAELHQTCYSSPARASGSMTVGGKLSHGELWGIFPPFPCPFLLFPVMN